MGSGWALWAPHRGRRQSCGHKRNLAHLQVEKWWRQHGIGKLNFFTFYHRS